MGSDDWMDQQLARRWQQKEAAQMQNGAAERGCRGCMHVWIAASLEASGENLRCGKARF